MNLQEILKKYPRPDKMNRTAELAALILQQSITVEPVTPYDAAVASDSVVYPKPETMHPNLAAYVAGILVSRAEQLHKLAEHDCNYGLDERQEKRRDKIQAEIKEIAASVGFNATTSGDPRGCVVKLQNPKDETAGDNWGGGWGVYR